MLNTIIIIIGWIKLDGLMDYHYWCCFPSGSGAVEGDVLASLASLASLAPPVHLSGERLGWTLLVCMVGDFRRGHVEVSWRSPSEGHMSTATNSFALNRKHRGQRAVSIITVVTSDWPSYSCSVSHRRHPKVIRRHHTTSAGRTQAALWTYWSLFYSLTVLITISFLQIFFIYL